jgi:hypothetical protein
LEEGWCRESKIRKPRKEIDKERGEEDATQGDGIY